MKRHHSQRIVHPETMRFWVSITFNFACELLWPAQVFSPREVLAAYRGIQNYYEQIPPEDFTELIAVEYAQVRLRLALYLLTTNAKNMLLPSELFDAQNPNGMFYAKPQIFAICGPVQICLN